MAASMIGIFSRRAVYSLRSPIPAGAQLVKRATGSSHAVYTARTSGFSVFRPPFFLQFMLFTPPGAPH